MRGIFGAFALRTRFVRAGIKVNMVIQVLAPIIPACVAIAKIHRNSSDPTTGPNNNNSKLEANGVRMRSVVDRLTAGGCGAPIAHWSEQHLERMIKTNGVFKIHADELRRAHTNARL